MKIIQSKQSLQEQPKKAHTQKECKKAKSLLFTISCYLRVVYREEKILSKQKINRDTLEELRWKLLSYI